MTAGRWPKGARRARTGAARRIFLLLVSAASAGAVPWSAALAQQASAQGFVTSAETEGPLEGVAILLLRDGEQAYSTLTDRNGYYQLGGIQPGTYQLQARHIAHIAHEETLDLDAGERLLLNLRLTPGAVTLEGVVVSQRRGATVRDLGRQRVTPAEVRLVPVPAGSGDLASYLQTLPGVTTTGDRGGQLFVRGGSATANLVLVDGIPIYQPFHIVGFFSVFPEELISSVDFYAGGFGARYSGRTSSVLDVQLRDGDSNGLRAGGSLSPFLAEAVVEGPLGGELSWMASARRSLIQETSAVIAGEQQPLTFESQLVKVTSRSGEDLRCSALALRTVDRGRMDAREHDSRVGWRNLLFGGRCVTQFQHFLRLLEVTFSATSVENEAISRGSSRFSSGLWRAQHDAHATTLLGSLPVYAGYQLYTEIPEYDLTELFGLQDDVDLILGIGGYVEAAIPFGARVEVRPGVVLTASPTTGMEPRLRASWSPGERDDLRLEGAVGLYRQHLVGASDLRDVGSVFTAWMNSPEGEPLEALHTSLGWQQSVGSEFRWSVDGYYRRMWAIPVPAWQAVAQFNTRLGRAEGESYGLDTRVEYSRERLRAFVGYGYGWTQYAAPSESLGDLPDGTMEHFHPPHDRRHQLNALLTAEIAGVTASARWQLGSGLPFTQPIGFDEAFDFGADLHDVSSDVGETRLIVDRPFRARLPPMHRLDLSLRRGFDLTAGRLDLGAGIVNAYDRRNVFYYDLFSQRRVDQLPLVPYASVTFRSH